MPRICFEVAGITDQGMVRASNQDSFVVRPDLGLFVVADGVSNSTDGGLAAALAVREVERSFERARRAHPSSRMTCSAARGRLRRAFECAQRRVVEIGRRYPQHAGMATTLAAMVVVRNRVVVCHVGDSRVYRVRARNIDYAIQQRRWRRHDALEQLTVDHNVENDRESCTNEERKRARKNPPNLQLLTRTIGHDEPLRVTTRIEKVDPEDMFMLCTDGLHGVLHRVNLEPPLRYVGGMRNFKRDGGLPLPEVQCTWLIERVKEHNAPDNVTAIVIHFRRGRGLWRTEREIGRVVHAPPRRAPRPHDPARELGRLEACLTRLGFLAPRTVGTDDMSRAEARRVAIREFQDGYLDLEPTGTLDDSTRRRLGLG